MLSSRGARASAPALSYWSDFSAALADLHDPANNPAGAIPLCVAENGLSAPLVAARLTSRAAPLRGVLGYDDMRGRASLRGAFAALAEARITRGARVRAEALCVSAGCGALIAALATLLLEAGDGVLLPVPTYGALYNDFSVLAGAAVIDVPRGADAAGAPRAPDVAALEAAAVAAEARGVRPRMLFLINPCNPTGAVLGRGDVAAAMAWARARGLHVVVDEVYALSVWGEGGEPFVSAATIAADAAGGAGGDYLGGDVHILWGFSKDFCASGLRTGVLFTHNAALLAALSNVNYFATVSNDTQDALAALVADATFVDGFLAANAAALRGAYALTTAALRRARVPFAPATSGMFVWLSLRELLPAAAAGEGAWARERALAAALFAEEKLVLTPGEAMHAAEEGCFRLCFAWPASIDTLHEALRRLEGFVARRRAALAA